MATPTPNRRRPRLLLLAMAILGLAAFVFLHSRAFLVRRIVVTGLVQLPPAEVRTAAAIAPGTYLWELRPWNVARRVELLPLVGSARVQLVWPDTVAIAVRERESVIRIAFRGGIAELDGFGRALTVVAVHAPRVASRASAALPLVTGVNVNAVRVGRLLAAPGLWQALAIARGLGVEGRVVVTEIHRAVDGTFTLTLHNGVTVRFGDGADARRKTEELLGMLDVIGRQHLAVAYIDLETAATPTLRLR